MVIIFRIMNARFQDSALVADPEVALDLRLIIECVIEHVGEWHERKSVPGIHNKRSSRYPADDCLPLDQGDVVRLCTQQILQAVSIRMVA